MLRRSSPGTLGELDPECPVPPNNYQIGLGSWRDSASPGEFSRQICPSLPREVRTERNRFIKGVTIVVYMWNMACGKLNAKVTPSTQCPFVNHFLTSFFSESLQRTM